MKPDYEKIEAIADFKKQQKELKKAMREEIEDADIVICIKANKDCDIISLADYVSAFIYNTSNIDDYTTFACK